MKALLRKELAPFLAPALAGALLFTAVYALAFDVYDALLAPPSKALPVVIIAALCMGGLLGYGQLAVERHGGTLAFLLHREQPAGRLLAAKCIAGWTLLGVVVYLPLLLFALWERWLSPLGPVVQWGRLGELWLAALVCVPAHALGMLCATLRCAPGWRTALLALLLAGTALAIMLFFLDEHGGPAASRAIYAAASLLFGALLLFSVRSELFLVEDADRLAPAGRLLSLGLLSLVLIGVPASMALTVLQYRLVLACHQPDLTWREDVGLLRTISSDGWIRAAQIDGSPIDLVPLIRLEKRDRVNAMDMALAGFKAVPVEPNVLAPCFLVSPSRATPSIAPTWELVGAIDFIDDGNHVGGARAFLDARRGQVHVLHSTTWPDPQPRAYVADASITGLWEPLDPTLRSLVRGDGKPFSQATFPSAENAPHRLEVVDEMDGSHWSLDLEDPRSVFQHVPRELVPSPPRTTEDLPRIFSVADGDLAVYTLRVKDRVTKEILMQERYGPLATGQNVLPLIACELLHPPVLILRAHRATPPSPPWDTVHQASLSAYGRRPQLVLASFAIAAAVAWRVRRQLTRRGAERWRSWAWTAALLLFGLQAWLVYLALERRATRAPSPRPASRRVLVEGAPVLE